jgi:LuxR family quorum-sensing transcriptional regulator LasR
MDDASVSALSLHASAIHKAIFRLADSRTETDIRTEIKQIAALLGFDFYHYVGNFPIHGNDNALQILSNLPASQNESQSNDDHGHADPIFESIRARLTPMFWRPTPTETANHDDIPHLSNSGIGDGIIFPVHARSVGTAALGFFLTADRGDATQTIAASLGDVSLTAAYLHESMARIASTTQQMPRVPLTRREMECLYWIAHHKSNWAIAKIIGISEHGVVYYVRRLMWKLDAQNRYHAVARASACGMLSNGEAFDR